MSAQQEATDAWPDYFPEADCPPAGANPAIGTLYRFCKKQPPHADDLACHWQLFEDRRQEFVAAGKHCQSCGLSVYLTADDARAKTRKLKALKKMHLYVVTLVDPNGKLLRTPSATDPEHHTWWAQTEVEEILPALVHVEGPSAA